MVLHWPRPLVRPRSPKRGPNISLSRTGVAPPFQENVNPLADEAAGNVWLWFSTRFDRFSATPGVPSGAPEYWKRRSL